MTDAEQISLIVSAAAYPRAVSQEVPNLLLSVGHAGPWVWDEFFRGQIRCRNTRAAYSVAVRRFLSWMEEKGVTLEGITPGLVGEYLDCHPGSLPTKKQHLSAIRKFCDLLVNRHVLILNPAATVRSERYQVIEGKTPEISRDQARTLLASVDTTRPVGRRDKAVIAVLIYTAARAGAVAALRLRDFAWDGTQYSLRFLEKGGKDRRIPVRHDLQLLLISYLSSFDWQHEPSDAPLFRSAVGRTGGLTNRFLQNIDICRMVKRRLADASLPTHLSPHSFRVATVTDLLLQGISLEDVQYLAGHADPRVTRLYDRRQKQVTRNTVERISI